LFNRMTGLAPDSQHCARYRSSLRRLKSLSSPATIKAVSTLAASTCLSMLLPATFRAKWLRRGRTACNVARSPSSRTSALTQSPTAGQSPPASHSPRSLPEGAPQVSPKSPAIRHKLRCCDTTRAGTQPGAAHSGHMASKNEFQPNPSLDARLNTRLPSRCPRAASGVASTQTQRSYASRHANVRAATPDLDTTTETGKRKGGRCYLEEAKSLEAHPPARTSTGIVTGTSSMTISGL
jgi:hypothetical protein